MMLLPKKVGPFTLMRRLGSDGVTESFVGILDEPAGKQVLVHRLLPWIVRDGTRLAAVEARIHDLTGIRHPVLVPVLDYVDTGDDRFVVEEWVDAVDVDRVLAWCRENKRPLPHNIYLNLATQVCNGLEALHGRPGKASGAENVLHLGLQPSAVLLTPEGKLVVGGYGLVRSPTSLPHGGADTDGRPPRMEYLSPEQTHPDQKLTPASDIFALGTILYELLTLEPLFRAESNLQTIHRVRRAEVTTPLLRVKELLPGLDKVLYRALSLNPRHRYQRAFVLREDLRGLMSGFSFARIADETRDFLAPLFEARGKAGRTDPEAPRALSVADAPQPSNDPLNESTAGILAAAVREQAAATARRPEPDGDGDGDDTAALIRRAQERRGGKSGATLVPSDDVPQTSLPPTPAPVPRRSEPPAPEVRPEPPAPAAPSRSVGEDTQWLKSPSAEAPKPPAPLDPSLTLPPAPVRDPSAVSMPPQAPISTAEVAKARLKHEEAKTSWTKRGTLTPEPAPQAAPPPLNEFDDEKPTSQTDVKRVTPEPARSRSLAESAPPPKPPPAASYVDDAWNEPPPRSNTGVFVGIAAVGALVVGTVVCLGVGGLTFLGWDSGDAGSTVVADGTPPPVVAPPPAPAPEGAADPAPEAPEAPKDGAGSAKPPAPSTTAASSSPSASADPAPRASSPSPSRSSSSAAASAVDPFEDPRPTRTSYTPSTSQPSTARSSSSSSSDAKSRQAAVAAFDVEPPPVDPLDDGLAEGLDLGGDMASYARKATAGDLSDADRMALDDLPSDDPDYARAKILLYEDAKARGDAGDQRRAMKAAMAVPENQYNPALLAEEAALAIQDGDYERAIAKAELAERHWQRLPSELIFSRKAMIYETQAAGWQGVFYQSGGDDLDALQNAIRCWQKYQRHVETKSKGDLSRKADEQLAKLYDMQRRLE